MTEFSKFGIFTEGGEAKKAALLFSDEIKARTGVSPVFCESSSEADFLFQQTDSGSADCYEIFCSDSKITFRAKGIRGLIYAYGMFLRRIEKSGNGVKLIEDIGGSYVPGKRIRGHQIGYRTTPNTYDAWSYEDYRRYYLDMMYFGSNTVEHIPYEKGVSRRNPLMKYDEEEFLIEAGRMADEFDLDVSLWHPNNNGETVDEAAERRRKLYARVPRINAVFPPGGDPGDYPADEFIERCKAISAVLKESHPDAEMWPSAQAPHSIPNWGDVLIEELEKLPDEIDGIIMGPNHAFPLDELRRKVPSKYPIRFYPDISHNVRCEYPVHFDRDDWHFALTSALSRECTNPRPREYRHLHRITRQYTCGSVSYSEGITDDVNKAVWADMEFFPRCDLRTTLLDYARLFFFGADAQKIADGILDLEMNWEGDPAENHGIDSTLALFEKLGEDYAFLNENWRFLQLLMRAKCDWVIRRRRLFELELIKEARIALEKYDLTAVREILERDFDENYKKQRNDINLLADRLFNLIGLQTDTAHYYADGWERGAILETMDNPVTDRRWLLSVLEKAEKTNDSFGIMRSAFDRNKVDGDEYYFSVALNGLKECGCPQTGEVYMDFEGDKPRKDGSMLPTGMFCTFDNFSFRSFIGGLTADCDYLLKVSFKSQKSDSVKEHTVKVNGNVIYCGPRFGGEPDKKYDELMLAPGFESVTYVIPNEYICNGCIELEMNEPTLGVMFSEFRIVKSKNKD
ncbi:MAG: hypothetical protein MJ173_06430 [Clostridia bacterium]|nr:hypothetical protein [Clostridia bacterium]